MLTILIVIGTSIAVLLDAKKIGLRSKMLPGVLGSGPWGWFLGSLFVWIIVFPLYLFYARPRYAKAISATPAGHTKPPPGKALPLAGVIAIAVVVLGFLVGKGEVSPDGRSPPPAASRETWRHGAWAQRHWHCATDLSNGPEWEFTLGRPGVVTEWNGRDFILDPFQGTFTAGSMRSDCFMSRKITSLGKIEDDWLHCWVEVEATVTARHTVKQTPAGKGLLETMSRFVLISRVAPGGTPTELTAKIVLSGGAFESKWTEPDGIRVDRMKIECR